MPSKNIPEKTSVLLWGKAAGRCEYEGCNRPVWLDPLTKTEFNVGDKAHIIPRKPTAARGDEELPADLEGDIHDVSNIMLLCDDHHELVDKGDVKGHPAERLREMKRKHEERIELLTSITEEKQSHILIYGANTGEHFLKATWAEAASALIPDYCPAEKPAIELSLINSSLQDDDPLYWQCEHEHLRRQYRNLVKPRLAIGDIRHLSVFGSAPQPLLVELGRLISDITPSQVYQRHREPQDWKWRENTESLQLQLKEPDEFHETVALSLSLSGTINAPRITSVLGSKVSIWEIFIETPNTSFMKSKEQLRSFREIFGRLLDQIKTKHGESIPIHVFPAAPVSVAVEIGRVWQPKADLPLIIYDENKKSIGFNKALEIRNLKEGLE